MNKKNLTITVVVTTALLGASHVALAIPMVTSITAQVASITGDQLPSSIGVNDTVTFRYEYDDEGTEMHSYYPDGSVHTIPISTDPNVTSLSDAVVTYSNNLLATFSEFTGSNGYPFDMNSASTWSVNRYFVSWIYPSVHVYMGYDVAAGLTNGLQGHFTLWSSDQQVTTVFFDVSELSTIAANQVPEPETFGIFLAGLGLLVSW